ncbi:MAG: GNAT family N-acetyltransferase [Ramlibacter sp.]|nr:GNAT family N-acetyltransferase [Ramlibacter sp.]
MTGGATTAVQVLLADYDNPVHADAIVDLLDSYALDVSGGGQPLSGYARTHLVAGLKARPQAFSLLAWDGDQAVGLANCIEGFSTFAALPLVNLHDLAVRPTHRGRGVGAALLAGVEREARSRGACKLTLEVLSGNRVAIGLYERTGFAGYQLDPAMGHAVFLQKWLEEGSPDA